MSARTVRIAAAQYSPVFGDVETNATKSISLMEDAARDGVKLLVLPECCLTGYNFDDSKKLRTVAEDISGDRIAVWHGVCNRLNLTLVAGIVERVGDDLFNTAVIISPIEKPVRYRKIHLWGIERNLYRAGDQPMVVSTPVGRIGISICYDLWFPELSRALKLSGAEALVSPANWAGNAKMTNVLDHDGRAMGYHLARTTACVNEMPVIVADRVGVEDSIRFLGNSCIVSSSGEVVTGPADDREEITLIGDLTIGEEGLAHRTHLASRRLDVYSRPPAEVIQ